MGDCEDGVGDGGGTTAERREEVEGSDSRSNLRLAGGIETSCEKLPDQ